MYFIWINCNSYEIQHLATMVRTAGLVCTQVHSYNSIGPPTTLQIDLTSAVKWLGPAPIWLRAESSECHLDMVKNLFGSGVFVSWFVICEPISYWWYWSPRDASLTGWFSSRFRFSSASVFFPITNFNVSDATKLSARGKLTTESATRGIQTFQNGFLNSVWNTFGIIYTVVEN